MDVVAEGVGLPDRSSTSPEPWVLIPNSAVASSAALDDNSALHPSPPGATQMVDGGEQRRAPSRRQGEILEAVGGRAAADCPFDPVLLAPDRV